MAERPVLRAGFVPVDAARFRGVRVAAFAGIGRPAKFFASLRRVGAEIVMARPFPDHHRFSPAELIAAAPRRGACRRASGDHREGLGAASGGGARRNRNFRNRASLARSDSSSGAPRAGSPSSPGVIRMIQERTGKPRRAVTSLRRNSDRGRPPPASIPGTGAPMRLSILDDYQGVALDMADWSPVRARGIEIVVERHPFVDEDAAARALADSEIVAAMRERTPFPQKPRRAPAETEAADHDRHAQRLVRHGGAEGPRRHGVRHRRAGRRQRGHRRARLGPDPRRGAPHRRGSRDHAPRRLADPCRPSRRGQDAGPVGSRPARQRGGAGRARLRHEGDRLEPEPDGRESRRARRRAGRKGRAVPPLRHTLGASRAEHAQPRPGRRARNRADEAERDPGQHIARPDRRYRSGDRGAQGRAARLCRVRRLRQGAAADRSPAAAGAERDPDSAYRLRHGRELPQLVPADRRERHRLSSTASRFGSSEANASRR